LPDLAVFDLDGTLHRTEAALTPAIGLALEDAWAPVPSDSFIESLYGEPIPDICEALMPGAGEARHGAFLSALRTRQAQTVPASAAAYEGVRDMLADLTRSRWDLAVCSNAIVDYIELVTRALGIRGCFRELSGLVPGLSKAERIRDLSIRSGGLTVVVGDRYIDMEAAVACGLPSIGCTWGYGSAPELSSATLLADSPKELPGLLEELRRRNGGGSTP
jgi:phosphoglycolate phosphatase